MGDLSPDEREAFASRIFERFTFIPLRWNEDGSPSRVDYISEDLSLSSAVEVTSHTNQSRSSLVNGTTNFTGSIKCHGLGHDWLVQTRDFPHMKNLERKVVPELRSLNMHGLTEYHKSLHEWWMSDVPTLKRSIAVFNSSGVESLKRGKMVNDISNVAELIVLPSINWIYGGPDSALEIVEQSTVLKIDNRNKLLNSNMKHRHLFVILDSNTDPDVREAFHANRLLLPSRPPNLPMEITHLWLVDFQTELGWYFQPSIGWQVLK